MLIADGGGYGGTNWMAMDVVQMWQAIQNQDTTAHYQLLAGWRKSYELILEHMGQVQNYRESLAAAWPPEKSPAAAAYIQELDGLIAKLQGTYDAAVANYGAFSSATLALSLSRDDVKNIYDEYTANQTKLEEFKNRPYVAAGKSAVPPQKPPVPDGRQEQLNNQARTIMYGLSSEIIQAKTQITMPPAYTPPAKREGSDRDNGSATYTAPVIPPITTFDAGNGSSNSTPSTAQHSTAPHTTNPGTNPSAPPNTARPPGLVLGGVQPTPPTVAPATTGILPQPPIGGGPVPIAITPTPVLPPNPIGLGSPGLPPGPGMTKSFIGAGPGRPGIGGLRAMAPGGVIGGPPAGGLGQPAAGGRPASRVNPVGGVIRPGNTEGRVGSAGRSSASGQPLGNLAGRNTRGHDESKDTSHWDPDNPWEIVEGVSPVVLPAAEHHVDPGPAIGLQ
jgi:hypothetical protein